MQRISYNGADKRRFFRARNRAKKKMCRAQRRTQSFPNCAALAQTEDGESVSEAARSVYRLLYEVAVKFYFSLQLNELKESFYFVSLFFVVYLIFIIYIFFLKKNFIQFLYFFKKTIFVISFCMILYFELKKANRSFQDLYRLSDVVSLRFCLFILRSTSHNSR